MVEGITGTAVVSVFHDICTGTGDEVVLFSLAQPPVFRDHKSAAPVFREHGSRGAATRRDVLA
jgi:hypothetical protein